MTLPKGNFIMKNRNTEQTKICGEEIYGNRLQRWDLRVFHLTEQTEAGMTAFSFFIQKRKSLCKRGDRGAVSGMSCKKGVFKSVLFFQAL